MVTSSVMTFDRCRFENSTVVSPQVTGGTLHVTGGAVSIRGCVFRGNYIRASGGMTLGWARGVAVSRWLPCVSAGDGGKRSGGLEEEPW